MAFFKSVISGYFKECNLGLFSRVSFDAISKGAI